MVVGYNIQLSAFEKPVKLGVTSGDLPVAAAPAGVCVDVIINLLMNRFDFRIP